VILQLIAVVVQPAVVVSGAVGEELALHVVLADGLAVRGGVHVLDVHYLVLWALLTGEPVEEVALTGKVLLTIVTAVQVGEGSSVDTVLLPVAAVVICGPATAPVKPAGSPVFSTLLSPVAPELTLRVVLTDSLAVTGRVDVSDLSNHVIVTQLTLSHITWGQGRLHSGGSGGGGGSRCGGPHSGGGDRGGPHGGGRHLHGGRPLSAGRGGGLAVRDRRRRRTTHTARAGLRGVTGGEEETLGPDEGEEVALRVIPAGTLTFLHGSRVGGADHVVLRERTEPLGEVITGLSRDEADGGDEEDGELERTHV